MTEYAVNLAASLQAGALLSPNEAARAVLPLAEALALEHEHGMVRGGVVPAYVAPEVGAGGPPTAATDVWAVGALLFHAMAGHAPYEHSPEAPARLRRAGWLGPLVEQTLAEDPAARPTMAEVASYLRSRDRDPAQPEPTVHLPAPPPPPTPTRPPTRTHAAVRVVDRATRERRTRILAIVLAATVVVLAVVAGVLINGSGGGPQASAPTTSAPATTTHAPTTAAATKATPRPPTAGTLEAFARTYVMAASRDPSAGIRFLTAAYRRASPDYQRFWASVSNPRILRMHADAKRMTVTYTYRYTLPGAHHRSARTETVTIEVVQQGGRLRIAGAH